MNRVALLMGLIASLGAMNGDTKDARMAYFICMLICFSIAGQRK